MIQSIISFLKNNKIVITSSFIPVALPLLERLISEYVSVFWEDVLLSPFDFFYFPIRLLNDVIGIKTISELQILILLLPIIYTGILAYLLKKLFTHIFYNKYLTYVLRVVVILFIITGISVVIYNSYETHEYPHDGVRIPEPPVDKATEEDPLVIEQTSTQRGNITFRYEFYNNQTRDIENGKIVFPDCVTPMTEKTANLSLLDNTFSVQKDKTVVGTFTVKDHTAANRFVCNVDIKNSEDTKWYDQVGVAITKE